MRTDDRAVGIDLKSFSTPQMRAFHMSWLAFFLCFFGWFGIAPLMAVIRDELLLTKTQVGNTIIASVAATVIARPIFGWLCDRFGPRRTYAWLLILGALPVASIGLALVIRFSERDETEARMEMESSLARRAQAVMS